MNSHATTNTKPGMQARGAGRRSLRMKSARNSIARDFKTLAAMLAMIDERELARRVERHLSRSTVRVFLQPAATRRLLGQAKASVARDPDAATEDLNVRSAGRISAEFRDFYTWTMKSDPRPGAPSTPLHRRMQSGGI